MELAFVIVLALVAGGIAVGILGRPGGGPWRRKSDPFTFDSKDPRR